MQFHDELPSKKEILNKTILCQCRKISKMGSKIISSWLSYDRPDLEDLGSYSDRLATLWYARQVGETKSKVLKLWSVQDSSCYIIKKYNLWQTLQFSKLEFFAFTGPSSNLVSKNDDQTSVHEPICPASSAIQPVNTDEGSQSHKCKASTLPRNQGIRGFRATKIAGSFGVKRKECPRHVVRQNMLYYSCLNLVYKKIYQYVIIGALSLSLSIWLNMYKLEYQLSYLTFN